MKSQRAINMEGAIISRSVAYLVKDVEIVGKNGFTGVRFWLALPVTLPDGCKSPSGKEIYQARGPFMYQPGDDDSAAVTFWGKAELKTALTKALKLLEDHKKDA